MTNTAPMQHTEESLKTWLRQRVASYVRLEPEAIESGVALAEYGLDSVYALTLTGDIEDYLLLTLDPTLMWDHPTIDALTIVLLDMLAMPV
jgi:acyl carrier protein